MTIRPQPNDHPHLVRARLRLYGMRAAYDEVMTTGIKRRHEPSRIVGELLSAEIAEKPARSIKYQLTIAKLPPETCDVQAPHQRTGSGYGHRCNFPIASLSRRIHCGRSIPRLHRRNGPVRRHQRHPGLFQFTRPGVDPRVSAGEICISNPVNNMQIATTFTTGLWRLQPEYLSQRADTGAAAVFRAYFPCHQAAAPVPKPAPMPSANPGELASDIGAEYGLPPSGFYQYALDGCESAPNRDPACDCSYHIDSMPIISVTVGSLWAPIGTLPFSGFSMSIKVVARAGRGPGSVLIHTRPKTSPTSSHRRSLGGSIRDCQNHRGLHDSPLEEVGAQARPVDAHRRGAGVFDADRVVQPVSTARLALARANPIGVKLGGGSGPPTNDQAKKGAITPRATVVVRPLRLALSIGIGGHFRDAAPPTPPGMRVRTTAGRRIKQA
jgi:hypothetical protein